LDYLTDTRIRQAGERVEIVNHRQGDSSVMLTFSPSEAESVAEALAAKAAEARSAQREA
jgi:hypothetical protein